MAASNVVIVESPAKAKTINKYLGNTYKVLASYGHVRDLAAKDGSVKPDSDFDMSWEIQDPRPPNTSTRSPHAVKGAKKLILATDPDREGEAISWHRPGSPEGQKKVDEGRRRRTRRLQRHHEGRRSLEAMANPRQIDGELVDAYLARRALDYLVGLQPLADPLAQAAGRPLGRPRAVGRPCASSANAKMEIEKFKTAGILDRRCRSEDAVRRQHVRAADKLNGEKLEKFSLPNEASAEARAQGDRSGQVRGHKRRVEAGAPQPLPAVHDLDLAARGRAQTRLLGQATRCASPSASMKAWTSTAKRSASSPICVPTASTLRPRR